MLLSKYSARYIEDMQPKNPEYKFNNQIMGDSGFASAWKVVEAPNKIAALKPLLPT